MGKGPISENLRWFPCLSPSSLKGEKRVSGRHPSSPPGACRPLDPCFSARNLAVAHTIVRILSPYEDEWQQELKYLEDYL